MQLNINDKTYNGKFGIKFIRALDEKFGMKRDDVELGMALSVKMPTLLAGDPVVLADFLHLSTVTETPRPSLDDVEEFIENHEDIEALFDEVIAELGKSNATKLSLKKTQKSMNMEEPKE